MNIPDAYSHPLFNADVDRTTHFTTRNILCTAIKDMSGHNIAVVQVRATHGGGGGVLLVCIYWAATGSGDDESQSQ